MKPAGARAGPGWGPPALLPAGVIDQYFGAVPRYFPALVTAGLLACGLLAPSAAGQVTIVLKSVIGAAGTDAATVAGVGNAVNIVGFGSNSGATTLTASGSTGSSAFNFNTGFSDGRDRATGSNPNSGAAHVYVDRKYDSGFTGPLILDTNADGSYSGETAQSGFGMHSDGFITFDLAVIRANFGLAANEALKLTGSAGIANAAFGYQTSGAIIADGTQLAVFDWKDGAGNMISSYSLTLSGSARYLTFAGLSGLDNSNIYDHVGFINVQLQQIPEPAIASLILAGLGLLVVSGFGRRAGLVGT